MVPATSGSKTLKDATNEAMRDWINNPVDTHYIIGSVVGPHPYPDMVAIFQSIISEETKKQLIEQTGSEQPDYVLACVGGGSNAMGMFYHFMDDENVKLIAVEAAGKGLIAVFCSDNYLGQRRRIAWKPKYFNANRRRTSSRATLCFGRIWIIRELARSMRIYLKLVVANTYPLPMKNLYMQGCYSPKWKE